MKLVYSASEALDMVMRNEARAWCGEQPARAEARFKQSDFLKIYHKPKFRFDMDTPIFTIGSCFAREVEATLIKLNVPLVTKDYGVGPEFFDSWNEENGWGGGVPRGQLSRGALNKYCVHSMTHELRRVLLDEKYPNEGMFEITAGQWFDPHSSGLRNLPLEQALKNRQSIADAMAQIRNASVVFMTLGLTESWIDTETGLAMNRHPGGPALRKYGTRFQFVDYDFVSVVEELGELFHLIRETCNAQMRFVVTVSPVPLGATFRDSDVIVANSASKSVLRAAAEEVRRLYDFVDYFPSYEMVVNSPRGLAWESDQLHVSPAMVGHIMDTFSKAYFAES